MAQFIVTEYRRVLVTAHFEAETEEEARSMWLDGEEPRYFDETILDSDSLTISAA